MSIEDKVFIGIDLGTTNSVLATVNLQPNGNIVSRVINIERAVDMYSGADGRAKLTMRQEPTLPSCVYYNEENNFLPIVGNFAKSRYSLRPHLVAKSIKSQMGSPFAQGLSPDIPDKTPAQISARILQHMLTHAKRVFRRTEITDAIITVPANFDIGRQATLDAARIAGIKIYNDNGAFRLILLDEPEAVIYDFINQVHNGAISNSILDLSTPKNVMVFDLGGGTLDVTLHRISRREDIPDILDKEPLGINRYTLLGGDDFDAALADEMFKRYLEQYRANSEVVQRIRREKATVMPQFLNQAEELKIRVSMEHSDAFGNFNDNSAWGDEEDSYPVGGKISATGYAYDDNFTTQELEKIWSRFMGEGLKFEDFKNLDAVARQVGTSNIVFPILDVLKKASDKLGTENFKVDAVIMNGGMSRFYMVVNRLKEFFGFEPIVALDPDQAVARGAAVYHYLINKYAANISYDESPAAISAVDKPQPVSKNIESPISLVTTILPDSLYLLTQGNRYEEIIKTGTKLPHESEKFTGFKLPVATNKISIPIARRNFDNTYSVIAKGNMIFPEKYSFWTNDKFVVFTVSMNAQRIITMNAALCTDSKGLNILDKGTTEIAIAQNIETASEIAPVVNNTPPETPKVAAPVKTNAAPVKIVVALHNLFGFCRNFEDAQKRGNGADGSKYAEKIRNEKQNIISASNVQELADSFLRFIENETGATENFKMNCIIIGRKICGSWTDSQKRRLANFCMNQLQREINFSHFELFGNSVNTKIQAIYTLYMCGSAGDLKQLANLQKYDKFHTALLYTYAMTKTEINWLYDKFKTDCRRALNGNLKSGIQNTVHALGVTYRLGDGVKAEYPVKREKIVSELCEIIRSKKLNPSEIGCCFLALGLICDKRYKNDIAQKSLNEAQKLISDINRIYTSGVVDRFKKSLDVAKKMIQGLQLNAEEEEFLLIKIDD